MKINQKHEKEIIALNPFEAVRLRPQMYLGQISPVEEKIPIISHSLREEEKPWSPGFMHLIVEILENAFDEAKRMRGKMKEIHLEVDRETGRVTVRDTGGGFHKAASKHPKTKKSVVRTAYEELHAGSNFRDSSTNILGTHGVGASIVNILSKEFEVVTVNATSYVRILWRDFKVVEEEKRAKRGEDKRGTSVSFIPSPEVFKDHKWDADIIRTYVHFKRYLITLDPNLKGLKLHASFLEGGKKTPIDEWDWIPKERIEIRSKTGILLIWPSYEGSCPVSFINGSRCTGIHQKIVQDWINSHFGYSLAHHFYEMLLVIDLPSSLMRFADQNKTKYAAGRWEIESLLEEAFKGKVLRELKNSSISRSIEEEIEDKMHAENIKKIRQAGRKSKRKISEKYSPPSTRKEILYITEGLSAAGSIKQARNSEIEGVYALRGKIKNAKKLSDLTENKEILEIMSILGIEPGSGKSPSYRKIVIATDSDPDGYHISSLLIQFFSRWFPEILSNGGLFHLIVPLVSGQSGKEKKYFYTLDDYSKWEKPLTNIYYLKGLGSLSIEDWKWVMDNKSLFQLVPDRSSDKYLDIAFGESPAKRRKWLQGEN